MISSILKRFAGLLLILRSDSQFEISKSEHDILRQSVDEMQTSLNETTRYISSVIDHSAWTNMFSLQCFFGVDMKISIFPSKPTNG